MVAKELHVDLVHARVVPSEVAEEDRGLGDVGERGALAGEEIGQVGDRLAQLGLEAAAHELAVDDPDLTGDDEPPARPDDGGVGTNRLRHGSEYLTASERRWASRVGTRGAATLRRPPRR